MSKWIKFTGDKQPVPDGTPVKVKAAMCCEILKGKAEEFYWYSLFPIVAYKLRKGWQFASTLDSTVSGDIEVMFPDGSRDVYGADYVRHNISNKVLWRKLKD